MTPRQEAQDIAKQMQLANPTIKKTKEEGISSAIVCLKYAIAFASIENKDHLKQVLEALYDL